MLDPRNRYFSDQSTKKHFQLGNKQQQMHYAKVHARQQKRPEKIICSNSKQSQATMESRIMWQKCHPMKSGSLFYYSSKSNFWVALWFVRMTQSGPAGKSQTTNHAMIIVVRDLSVNLCWYAQVTILLLTLGFLKVKLICFWILVIEINHHKVCDFQNSICYEMQYHGNNRLGLIGL